MRQGDREGERERQGGWGGEGERERFCFVSIENNISERLFHSQSHPDMIMKSSRIFNTCTKVTIVKTFALFWYCV